MLVDTELLASTCQKYVVEEFRFIVWNVFEVTVPLSVIGLNVLLVDTCTVYDVAPGTVAQLRYVLIATFTALFDGYVSVGAESGSVTKLQVVDQVPVE